MCIYLYPLFRMRRERARASASTRSRDLEPGSPGTQSEEADKKSLMSWLYSRSRDRFSTHDSPKDKSPSLVLGPPSLRCQPSTTRGSLIPDLSSPTLTPPPPAYASRPSSPLAGYRFPSPLGSPRSPLIPRARPLASQARSVSPVPPTPARTRSATSIPQLSILAVRPFIAPRSVSASTLHPADAELHRPSRARVYSEGEGGRIETATSNVRRVPRNRESTGLGISLASRGRQLTRGPSFDAHSESGRVAGPF
ncbi:hypothetical protein C8F01DRAFT_652725 [Mycena amicta]|nr:hypothetical protein C8F01DRAFT_652725 [Mycena amicta]